MGFSLRWELSSWTRQPDARLSPSWSHELALWMLYCGNPFYCYPHKICCGLAFASGYTRAYGHFRSAHSKPLNLAIHVGCMAVALVANAALLHAVDIWLALDNGIVSILTLACYAAFLAHVPAPLTARALAIMALGVAFVLRDCVLTNWRWLLWFDSLIFAINFKHGDAKAVPTMPAVPLPLLIVVRYLVQLMLERTNGVLEEHCMR